MFLQPAILALLLPLQGVAAAQNPTQAAGAPIDSALSPQEGEVRALERRWLDAYERNDTAAMTEIVADDFTITFPNGKMDRKADILSQIRSLPPGPSSYRFHTRDVASRSYGDTVILTGIVVTESVRDGRPVREESSYTDTYVRRNGRWQVVASHLSGVPKP
jgi:uncharacterized protein (TIGR02246 family)